MRDRTGRAWCIGHAPARGAVRAKRQAMSHATPSSSAAIRNGAPGRCAGARGPMKKPKLPANIAGPTMPAIETRLISAPWMRPCTSGPTWRVISACVEGAAMPQIALIGMPFVLLYTAGVYYFFRGKVRLDDESY